MKISKNRIINVEQYTKLYSQNELLYVVARCNDMSFSDFQFMGFPKNIIAGMTILPKPVGPVSQYNANGKEIVHRNKPKETVYHDVWLKDWHGDYHSVDVPYERYPRTEIKAPCVEIKVIAKKGEFYFATDGISNSDRNKDLIKHCINLFLELFGVCELFDKSFTPIVKQLPVKRVNWQILPEGEKPWIYLSSLADENKNVNDKQKNLEKYRIETILGYKPDELYYGKGGFHGYLVFVFKKKKLVVMENIMYGNATYIFDKNWKALSQMTKAEIIQDKLMKYRLQHNHYWKSQLKNILK